MKQLLRKNKFASPPTYPRNFVGWEGLQIEVYRNVNKNKKISAKLCLLSNFAVVGDFKNMKLIILQYFAIWDSRHSSHAEKMKNQNKKH